MCFVGLRTLECFVRFAADLCVYLRTFRLFTAQTGGLCVVTPCEISVTSYITTLSRNKCPSLSISLFVEVIHFAVAFYQQYLDSQNLRFSIEIKCNEAIYLHGLEAVL
jgi:hypothetical protein